MSKVVIITGASGGIGADIARLFAEDGYKIVYHYNENKNEGLIEELSKKTEVLPVKADFAKKEDLDNLVDVAIKTYGKIDCLVNNAGKSQYKLILDESYESIQNLLSVNLASTIYLTSKVSKNMVKFSSGNIINISSIYARFGASGESVYSATKSAFTAFTSAIASELSNFNIRCNAVAPGAVDTPMNKGFDSASQVEFFKNSSIKRMATPKEIAKVVLFLAKPDSAYINGQTIYVDGGLSQY